MNKYRYNINNLDCANCAREIEEALNERSDFKNASVNFSTCKVSYESEKSFTLEELNKIIKEIEPDAYLTENKVDNVKKEFHLSIFLIAIIISAISYFFDLPKNVKLVLSEYPRYHFGFAFFIVSKSTYSSISHISSPPPQDISTSLSLLSYICVSSAAQACGVLLIPIPLDS